MVSLATLAQGFVGIRRRDPNKGSDPPAPHVAFARFLNNKTQPNILRSDPLAVYFFVVEYDACVDLNPYFVVHAAP